MPETGGHPFFHSATPAAALPGYSTPSNRRCACGQVRAALCGGVAGCFLRGSFAHPVGQGFERLHLAGRHAACGPHAAGGGVEPVAQVFHGERALRVEHKQHLLQQQLQRGHAVGQG